MDRLDRTKENEAKTSIDRLHELFIYDSETGVLLNKVSRGNAKRGRPSGTPSGVGYFQTKVDGTMFKVHRIIWAMCFGEWPDGDIDHINRIRSDNRIQNLRVVDAVGNSRNRGMHSRNSSGVNGVYFNKRYSVYKVFITINYKRIHLGYFKTLEEATAARKAAETLHGFSSTHGMKAETEIEEPQQ